MNVSACRLMGMALWAGALVGGSLLAEVRSIDGSGNNVINSDWGSAGSQFLRVGPVGYGDGISSMGGASLPGPRDISNAVFAQSLPIYNDRGLSDYVWQWGQFIDHDIALSPTGTGEFYPITVSGDDSMSPMIPFERTLYDPSTGLGLGNPRQQINANTSFLDASMVYGSDLTRANALRTFSDGLLNTSTGNMLPYNTLGLPNANDGLFNDETLYLAGDIRANEQVGLLSMHTLFMREHNRIAGEAALANPGWNDEDLYQYARRMVGAEIQVITYNEWLPSLMGDYAPDVETPGYDPSINPNLSNEFAAALFRIGHTMISPTILQMNNDGSEASGGPMAMKDVFFNPSLLSTSEQLEYTLMGLASQSMQEVDTQMIDDLRNFLFGPPGSGGLDLASLNIQRGRDHGLATYNEMRTALGLAPAEDFDDITSDPSLQNTLEFLYGDVDAVELWVGALAEDLLDGASVGELLALGLQLEFEKLRDGDRFYFLSDDAFTSQEIDWLMDTTLTDIIQFNTGIANMQQSAFFIAAPIPEPGTTVLILLGVLALLGRRMIRA